MTAGRVFRGIDELRQAVGSHLGYSGWHTVTQHQIDTFADATGDRQWIHVEPDKAVAGPFGSTIAHGYLTLSLVPMLVWQVYEVEGLSMGINYGSNKVRYPAPVPVGSELRAGVKLLSVEPGSGGYRVTDLVTVERKGADKPACVVEAVSLLVP